MDDLVVNENPNSNYVKEDSERTPDLRLCFEALRRDDLVMPRGVKTAKTWEEAQKAVKEARAKVEGKDYRVVVEDAKKVRALPIHFPWHALPTLRGIPFTISLAARHALHPPPPPSPTPPSVPRVRLRSSSSMA